MALLAAKGFIFFLLQTGYSCKRMFYICPRTRIRGVRNTTGSRCAASLPPSPAAPLPRRPAAPLPRCPAAPLPRCPAAPLPRCSSAPPCYLVRVAATPLPGSKAAKQQPKPAQDSSYPEKSNANIICFFHPPVCPRSPLPTKNKAH